MAKALSYLPAVAATLAATTLGGGLAAGLDAKYNITEDIAQILTARKQRGY
jgi:hypothetical protein